MNLAWFVTATFLLFEFININGVQHLYKFIPEHCELKNINQSLINVYYGKCIKKSRLELYFNLSYSLKEDVRSDDEEQMKVTGYQFLSNEYRKGPIELTLGLCSMMHSNDFDLPHMLSNSNLRNCPLLKGKTYYVYNLTPNATNYPPFLPDGRWMFEFQFTYQNKYEVMRLEWYLEIEYPIRVFEKRT